MAFATAWKFSRYSEKYAMLIEFALTVATIHICFVKLSVNSYKFSNQH